MRILFRAWVVLCLALTSTLAMAQVTQPPANVSGTTVLSSPPSRVGGWYKGATANGGSSTINANRLFLSPFYVFSARTISDLGITVGTTATATANLVICASDPATGWPVGGAPIAAVNVSLATAGQVSGAITSGTGAIATPGLYYRGIITDNGSGAPTFVFENDTGILGSVIGAANQINVNGTSSYSGIFYSVTYAAGTFTCGPGGAPTAYAFMPQVAYKVGSVP